MSEVRHATDPVSGQRVEIRNDLVKRLRGQYASGPTMPNGEPEFGWRQFGEPKPIELEAADEIERLSRPVIGPSGAQFCRACSCAMCRSYFSSTPNDIESSAPTQGRGGSYEIGSGGEVPCDNP